jgi:hypothetical protein
MNYALDVRLRKVMQSIIKFIERSGNILITNLQIIDLLMIIE